MIEIHGFDVAVLALCGLIVRNVDRQVHINRILNNSLQPFLLFLFFFIHVAFCIADDVTDLESTCSRQTSGKLMNKSVNKVSKELIKYSYKDKQPSK